jgi:hypothetical protein
MSQIQRIGHVDDILTNYAELDHKYISEHLESSNADVRMSSNDIEHGTLGGTNRQEP